RRPARGLRKRGTAPFWPGRAHKKGPYPFFGGSSRGARRHGAMNRVGVGADRRIARSGAKRSRDGGSGVRQASRLEVGPRQRILGEDVVTIGRRGFGDDHRLGDIPVVIREKARKVLRLGGVRAPS